MRLRSKALIFTFVTLGAATLTATASAAPRQTAPRWLGPPISEESTITTSTTPCTFCDDEPFDINIYRAANGLKPVELGTNASANKAVEHCAGSLGDPYRSSATATGDACSSANPLLYEWTNVQFIIGSPIARDTNPWKSIGFDARLLDPNITVAATATAPVSEYGGAYYRLIVLVGTPHQFPDTTEITKATAPGGGCRRPMPEGRICRRLPRQ